METEGGGWTELLSRRDGALNDFPLQTYQHLSQTGHGSPGGNSFQSLEFWHSFTSSEETELLVLITCSSMEFWSGYGSIRVGGSSSSFTLSIANYDSQSTAGDSLTRSSGQAFSTYDSDRDASPFLNCALQYRQPFWNENCGDANPLGKYGSSDPSDTLRWDSLAGSCSSISQIFFRVRRNRCAGGSPSPCISCKPGFFLATDSLTGREACFPYCEPQICSECHPSNASVCVGECAPGYFLDPTTRSCQRCHSLCTECSSSLTAPCSQCVSSAFSVPALQACVIQCPPAFYESSPKVCEACPFSHCDVCTSSDCLHCAEGFFLFNSTCSSLCPSGFFGDPSDGLCKPCAFGCLQCFGPSRTDCFSCLATDFQYIRQFTCAPYCPLTHYFNATSQSCQACDPNCAECFGPSADECEACAPGRNLKMNSCSRCEDTPGFTADPFDDGLCIEICGDGLDLGFNECEDGNLFNLDGCSSDCKLELDFECTSTSPTGPFHCKSLKPPTIIFAAITDDMALELYFSELISTTSTVTLQDIQFQISSPGSSRSISFSPLVNIMQIVPVAQLTIPLQLTSSLFGGEELTLTFLNLSKFRDMDDYSLVTSSYSLLLPEYEYYTVNEIQVMDSSTSLFSAASLKGFLINFLLFALVLFFSGLLWSLANFVQLLNFLPALNIFIPRNMRVLLSFLNIANLNIKFLEDLINLSLETHYNLDSFLTTNHLAPLLPYTQLLLNHGVLLLTWLLFLFFILLLALLIRIPLMSHKSKTKSLFRRCTTSYFALGLLESTLGLSLASFHNISKMGISTLLEIVSGILSFLVLGLLFTLPFWMIGIFSRHFTEYEEKDFISQYQRLSSLLPLKKKRNIFVIHFYTLFVARRLLFVFILFFLFDYPQIQLLLLVTLSFMVIGWVCKAKPFRDKLIYRMEILNECCLLAVILVLASIEIWDFMREYTSQIGWGCIALVLVSILANFFSVCPRESKSTLKAWRRICCKLKRRRPVRIHIEKALESKSPRIEKFRERDSTTELKLQIKEPMPSGPLKLFKSKLGVIRETGEVFSERNELEEIPEDPLYKLKLPQPRENTRSVSRFRGEGGSLFI